MLDLFEFDEMYAPQFGVRYSTAPPEPGYGFETYRLDRVSYTPV